MSEKNKAHYLDGKAGRAVWINQKELLFFSGYNYLGVAHHKEFNDLVFEGISRFGWLFPSSRISNTRLSIFEECEALLSAMTSTEDTVLLPSGFTAGQLATSTQGSALYNAPGSHPAIARNKSVQADFFEWSAWLVERAKDSGNSEALSFASDSLSPLSATFYDFSFISKIEKPLNVIIDDSHGVGLIGTGGRGISTMLPQLDRVQYTFTYSLSKAFGISGGAISCSKEEADRFRTLPEYTAVSPLSPALIHAFIKGQHIYTEQRKKLHQNISKFAELTKNLPELKFDPRFPVFILPPYLDETLFQRNNILISSFAYPDPAGVPVKRLVLNALHTQEDLETLAHVLHLAYTEASLI